MVRSCRNAVIKVCAFGQACYSRFGFSVMRDVINAGLDPHRWFAGVMNKVITPDLTHAGDPAWVEEVKKFLEEHVTKAQRQQAKMAKPKLAFQRAISVEQESELLEHLNHPKMAWQSAAEL